MDEKTRSFWRKMVVGRKKREISGGRDGSDPGLLSNGYKARRVRSEGTGVGDFIA